MNAIDETLLRLQHDLGAVVIGRNEGYRLKKCLESLRKTVRYIIYVDSGSSDNSVEIAKDLDVLVHQLDPRYPFTAARARHKGIHQLLKHFQHLKYIQCVDADCEVFPNWLRSAYLFLDDHDNVAVVCGRRRERFPDSSVYNMLCDDEWNTPVGQTQSCGGDVLIRVKAYKQAGGYNGTLIAGEEPELCVRLRQKRWKIWRLKHDMTWHDAAMMHYTQWWQRSVRAGHAFAEVYQMHNGSPCAIWGRETLRSLSWGLVLPLAIFLLASLYLPFILLILMYPLQILRLAARNGVLQRTSWIKAIFSVIGKFAETQGIIKYYLGILLNKRTKLIEYKLKTKSTN